MRLLLCISAVFLWASTAAAQFGPNSPRTAARSTEGEQHKTAENAMPTARPKRPNRPRSRPIWPAPFWQ